MMSSFTGYWLTRGRPHCLARWLSSSFSPLAGRAVSPVLLVAGLDTLCGSNRTQSNPPRTASQAGVHSSAHPDTWRVSASPLHDGPEENYLGPRQPRRGTTTRSRRSFARPTPPIDLDATS